MTDELPDQYKEMGPDAVRTLMQSGGLNTQFHRVAALWLSEQEALREGRSEAREAARDANAASALRIAKRANTIAIIAAAIAIIAAIFDHVIK